MTPTEGMILRSKSCGMVVVCLKNKIDCDPSMLFRGKVIDPGKLHKFHAKGDEIHTLNASDFEEVDLVFEAHITKKNTETSVVIKLDQADKDLIQSLIDSQKPRDTEGKK